MYKIVHQLLLHLRALTTIAYKAANLFVESQFCILLVATKVATSEEHKELLAGTYDHLHKIFEDCYDHST
jgi:hypothetical protein